MIASPKRDDGGSTVLNDPVHPDATFSLRGYGAVKPPKNGPTRVIDGRLVVRFWSDLRPPTQPLRSSVAFHVAWFSVWSMLDGRRPTRPWGGDVKPSVPNAILGKEQRLPDINRFTVSPTISACHICPSQSECHTRFQKPAIRRQRFNVSCGLVGPWDIRKPSTPV